MSTQKTWTSAAARSPNVVRARRDEKDHNKEIANNSRATDGIQLRRHGRIEGISGIEDSGRIRGRCLVCTDGLEDRVLSKGKGS